MKWIHKNGQLICKINNRHKIRLIYTENDKYHCHLNSTYIRTIEGKIKHVQTESIKICIEYLKVTISSFKSLRELLERIENK